MSDILASVSVVLGAEISGFKAAMAQARKELSGLVKFSEGLKDIGSSLTTYVSAPLALLGAAAVTASGKMESLKKGLEAITLQELGKEGVSGLGAVQQAATLTAERLTQLREVAKQPGLGFEAAVQGVVRLQAVGISFEQASKSIKAFANAVATTGGGKSELDRITVQLAQLSAKGKVLAQDLRPIIEAAPAVSGALQKLYGTVDSETISASLKKQGQSSTDFVAALTDELGKLPQVTGGLKNAFENLADTATLSLAKIGDGISKSLNLPGVFESLNSGLSALADGFTALSPPVQAGIVLLAGVAAAAGPVFVALGTLGAALPAIRAGFVAVQAATTTLGNGLAALLSPTTLVVVGLAALAAGIYYVATASDRALAAYREQAQQTDQLTATIDPLLARYQELRDKTVLNETEQRELTSLIQQLAQAVPGAVAAIDQYGKATGINTAQVTEFVRALQAQKQALAAQNLPTAQAELAVLAGRYDVLKKKRDEFNQTGSLHTTSFDGDVVVSESAKAGSAAVRQLQIDLANANVDYQKQSQLVQQLTADSGGLAAQLQSSLTPALTETDLALKFLGGQGQETAGLLTRLHEQLKALKQDQQDAATEKLALSYNPLIKNLQTYISRLEGADKAGKKSADAIAKLRLELSRLTALDNLLGNAPTQAEVLERRAAALAAGLKSLVDAGVNPSSRAFQGFATELVRVSQAFDKLQATSQLAIKPAAIKSLIPTTIGDTVKEDVARLLGDYAKEPIPVHFTLKPVVEVLPFTFENTLNKELLNLGKSFQLADNSLAVFGRGFDVAGAKVDAMRTAIKNLLSQGFSPVSREVKQLGADLAAMTREAQFSKAASDALQAGLSGLSSAAESIGSALASGDDAMQALLNGLLSTIGDFMAQYGRQLLLIGAGDIAIGNVAKGALEIGAGLALSAGAGAVKSIGGSSGAPYSPSTPTTANYGQGGSNVQTIKVVAEFSLRGKDLVAVGRSQDFRSKVGD